MAHPDPLSCFVFDPDTTPAWTEKSPQVAEILESYKEELWENGSEECRTVWSFSSSSFLIVFH